MEEKSVKLEEVTLLITDGKHGDCEDQPDSGFYFISAKDVKDGKINYENARQITEQDFYETHRRTRFGANDILITNSGTIGRMAFCVTDARATKTTFQKSVAIIKANSDVVIPKWLYYHLQKDINLLIETASGTAQKNLLLQDLRSFEIKLPPLPIQRRIAEVLGRYDALIENYQRQIGLLESLAQNLYREWFVRGRCPYAQAGGLPIGWERVKLGDVLELKYGKSLVEETRIAGEFPVVGSSGIVDTHNECLVGKPGIVVGRKGNVGSVFWIDRPFYPIDTAFYVETDLSLFYLFFNLQTQNFISGDAAVPGLNREQALSNKMLKPADEVLHKFDEIIRPNFAKIENLQSQITLLRQMRDKLLPRLMSGQLAVNGS